MIGVCELCQRAGLPLTKHHLIPRTRHSNKKNKKNFDRFEVKTRLAWLCRPCHSHAHCVLTEKEMEHGYNTLEALASHPEIRKFTEWIASKPAGFKPHSRPLKERRNAAPTVSFRGLRGLEISL